MIKRILVGLAGTTYTPIAIQRAIRLAQTHGAEVTGVTVLDVRRVRVVGGQGIPPWDNSSAIHGPAANLWQADMIVMGNSTRSVLLKSVLGDTLLETLRYTQIPLFLAQ